MAISDLTTFLTAAKTALDIIKGIRSELPQGMRKDEVGNQIDAAEEALETSEGELAKALGFKLCQCTFPPQIMLWKEQQNAFACPNPDCGRKIERPQANLGRPRSSLVDSRRGR